jgi:hypothetical protein
VKNLEKAQHAAHVVNTISHVRDLLLTGKKFPVVI